MKRIMKKANKTKRETQLYGKRTVEILKLIERKGAIQSSDIRKEIEIPPWMVSIYLVRMKNYGLIERTWRYWRLTKKGKDFLNEIHNLEEEVLGPPSNPRTHSPPP